MVLWHGRKGGNAGPVLEESLFGPAFVCASSEADAEYEGRTLDRYELDEESFGALRVVDMRKPGEVKAYISERRNDADAIIYPYPDGFLIAFLNERSFRVLEAL